MRAVRDAVVIQIDILHGCFLACTHCTRGVGHHTSGNLMTPEQVRESLEQGVAKGYDLLDMLASTGAVALLGDLIDHAIESDPGRLASPLRRGEVLFDATKVGN